ncbi:MAG: glycosyltransferase family 2 protein [Bacteroidia bacterium]|nr:glycosyltransferase family 2 protein [Bacteroidia bacterium]MCC7532412.1 glycosyltransferase family 2 protein [Bacteroidia bacterium]
MPKVYPEISIVASLYNSSEFIVEFVNRIIKSTNELKLDYEIIFIDDGSKDNSSYIVHNLIKENKNIRLIKFSRNYGHHVAMVCGLEHAKGEYIFLIDVDLEEQPELIIDFYKEILSTNNDLIYGVQKKRNKDKFLGLLFWKVLGWLTGLSLGNNPCTIRIMSQKFVKNLANFPQKDFFLGELSSYIGLNQSTLEVNKIYKGHSTYSFFKKYTLLFNMLFTNVSNLWIRLSFFSTIISISSFLFFLWLLASYFLGMTYLSGWLSIMVVTTFFASLNFFFFGVLLQFVSKVLDETRAKPRYLIDRKININ